MDFQEEAGPSGLQQNNGAIAAAELNNAANEVVQNDGQPQLLPEQPNRQQPAIPIPAPTPPQVRPRIHSLESSFLNITLNPQSVTTDSLGIDFNSMSTPITFHNTATSTPITLRSMIPAAMLGNLNLPGGQTPPSKRKRVLSGSSRPQLLNRRTALLSLISDIDNILESNTSTLANTAFLEGSNQTPNVVISTQTQSSTANSVTTSITLARATPTLTSILSHTGTNTGTSRPKSKSPARMSVTFQESAPSDTDPNNVPSSVSLQELLDIPENALETWRRARGHMSAEAKALIRADHAEKLADDNLLPLWTVGLAPLPGYLKPIIQDLTRLRHMQGLEMLRAIHDSLIREATSHRQAGTAQQHALQFLFGDQHESLRKAIAKIGILVNRDREECKNTLTKRTEALRNDPLKDETIQDNLLNLRSRARSGSPTPRNRSRSPKNNFRSNKRSNQIEQPGTNQENERPSRPKGRGNSRGRGQGRGRDSSRGRGPNRSRDSSRNRRKSNSRERRNWNNIYDEDIALYPRNNNMSKFGNVDRRKNNNNAKSLNSGSIQLSPDELAVIMKRRNNLK